MTRKLKPKEKLVTFLVIIPLSSQNISEIINMTSANVTAEQIDLILSTGLNVGWLLITGIGIVSYIGFHKANDKKLTYIKGTDASRVPCTRGWNGSSKKRESRIIQKYD